MPRMRFRSKILLSTSALLVLLIGAMILFVNRQAQSFVTERIASDLENGRQRIQLIESERLDNLRQTAQLVASFPNLNALLATDAPTIRDFLTAYQRENRRAELLIVLDRAGQVLARTDTEALDPIPDAARWTESALNERVALGILAGGRNMYHVAVAPAAAAGTVFGFVVAGGRIDNDFARRLHEQQQDEVVILGDRILGTTLPESLVPWRSVTEWQSSVGREAKLYTVELGRESYSAIPVALASGQGSAAVAVLLRSRDKALEPYRRIQLGLLVLGLAAALAGIAGSVVMARRVTADLGQLVEGTKQVAAGNFNTSLSIRSGDEIGDLADAFNGMTRGLRERADMQKFVSEATVKMIQAQGIASAGERRKLTVLFSDMRGFSAFSENRKPEDVVQVLNTCFSLQAQAVKKYKGDVDKYMGDCVVALFFGEDSALNAIRCGVEIDQLLDAYNAAHDRQSIEVGIGIVTGEAILGSVGSEDRRDFTAIGSNVNLCARLCSMAGPREILISESSYSIVQDLVAAERLEPVHLKGFTEPVPVYRVGARREE
jgi:class 3 adenylate cyclase